MLGFQGARTCYFSEVAAGEAGVQQTGDSTSQDHTPASSIFALENIIQQRVQQSGVPGECQGATESLCLFQTSDMRTACAVPATLNCLLPA